jgi:hypothetical protein
MEPEGSLPCSQEPSTGPYFEPDQFNPFYPIHACLPAQSFLVGTPAGTASVVQWSEFLATDQEARVQLSALPDKRSSGSGTGSTQPREYN